ncbi:MAG: hypothetical protein LQ342_001120 [Letrouitia transgressa]|nr:MAG: hypothetical protein LQ342_001120 [Letrouitia transgressa]
MHWALAISNACNGLTYVTRFSCDIFGFYVAFIYLQKGIQVLTRQWAAGEPSAYLSIMVALLVLVVGYLCGVVGTSSKMRYIGLLGIPFPNGLIPQAPFHTNSLCVTRQVSDESETDGTKGHSSRVVDHVVEQRVSNLAQGLLTLGTMSGPLLVVLHLIPRGVLAGLFFIMGVQALEGNGITLKVLHIVRDHALTSASDPLSRIQRKRAIWYFTGLELIGFGATFAITQTIAAIGFPIIILLLIPVRTFLLPRYFTEEELSILDAPTASPYTMESVGGNFGEDVDGSPSTEVPEQIDEGDCTERGEAGNRKLGGLRRRSSLGTDHNVPGDASYEMQQLRVGASRLSNRSRSRGDRS